MNLEIFNKEKIREYIFPLSVFFIIFFLSITFFRQTIVNAARLKLENQNLKKELEALEEKSDLLRKVNEEDLEKKVIDLEEVFPSEKPVLNLLTSLNQLAKENEVKFTGLSLKPGKIILDENNKNKLVFQKEEEKEQLQTFDIKFEIKGSLANLTAFLKNLEETAPLMRIEEVGLSLSGSTASLTVKVFYQNLPENLLPLSQKVALLSDEEIKLLEEIKNYRKGAAIEPISPVGKANPFLF